MIGRLFFDESDYNRVAGRWAGQVQVAADTKAFTAERAENYRVINFRREIFRRQTLPSFLHLSFAWEFSEPPNRIPGSDFT
jgi:hypothetical protein